MGLLLPAVPSVVQLPLGLRLAVAVILVVPEEPPVTVVGFPGLVTVATEGIEEIQVTLLTVAPPVMETVAVIALLPPVDMVREEGDRETVHVELLMVTGVLT